jgi:hypothetical protein
MSRCGPLMTRRCVPSFGSSLPDGAASADPSAFDYTTGPTTSGPTPGPVPSVVGPFDEQNSIGGSKTGYTV